MALYKQPGSDNWHVRITIRGRKIRCSTKTADRALAQEFEAKLTRDAWRQINLGERPRYTFRQAVARWRESPPTRDRLNDEIRLRWFDQWIADVPIDEIGRTTLDKMQALLARDKSRATANRYLATLRSLLRRAQREWDWIERAPAVPMFSTPKAEPRFLTREQFDALLEQLPAHLQAVCEFAVATGLRMRNITHLTWPQVDMQRRQLTVPASRAKAGETIAVPLSRRAMTIVRAQIGRHDERVFTFEGAPIDDANTAGFKKATARAGLPWLRFHDLRHTWASWHVQGGTPPHVLKELGGWKSSAMVERYAHLTVEHLRAFVEHRAGKGHSPQRRARKAK